MTVVKYVRVGVDYCTLHAGIRNEDVERCDFADDNDQCVLVPLVYLADEGSE